MLGIEGMPESYVFSGRHFRFHVRKWCSLDVLKMGAFRLLKKNVLDFPYDAHYIYGPYILLYVEGSKLVGIINRVQSSNSYLRETKTVLS